MKLSSESWECYLHEADDCFQKADGFEEVEGCLEKAECQQIFFYYMEIASYWSHKKIESENTWTKNMIL